LESLVKVAHLLFRQGEPLPTILALFIFSSLARICFGTAVKFEGIWHSFVHSPKPASMMKTPKVG
jgi:hypothetical protein